MGSALEPLASQFVVSPSQGTFDSRATSALAHQTNVSPLAPAVQTVPQPVYQYQYPVSYDNRYVFVNSSLSTPVAYPYGDYGQH